MGRVVVLLFASMWLSMPAAARTWLVSPDGTGDAPTVQAGIDSAVAGDIVLLAPGTYTWTSQGASGHSMIQLEPGVILRSEQGPERTVIDAEGQRRVFLCRDTGGAVQIEGLTIQGGLAWWTEGQPFAIYYGGGMLSTGASSPTITNCIFRNNTTGIDNRGGGLFLENGGTVTDCTFIDNGCNGSGGAMWARGARISRCIFLRNTAGGHGCGSGSAIEAIECTISDCLFEDNRSGGAHCSGGGTALTVAGPGRTEILRCTFRRHRGTTCIQVGSECQFDGCAFLDNDVTSGVVRAAVGSTVALVRCTIAGNRASGAVPEGPLITGPADIRACLFAFNAGAACSDLLRLRCSAVFGNGGSDAACAAAGSDNFEADPQFCAVDPSGSSNIGLQSDSPCAPGHHPTGADCGQIGAGPVACNAVSIHERAWTEVKSLFR